MTKTPNLFYLYLIIFIEGYIVLSTELLAIRQLVPFVGNGTETIAVIIAAVLMPLSLGYYHGGNFTPKPKLTVRKKLIHNVAIAAIFLTFGLSYILLELFFSLLPILSVTNRIAQTSIYTLIFLVYPTYLLGQTLPLITRYIRSHNISKSTGKVLACSTIGSFIGATLTTLVLMALIGVHNVVITNTAILLIVVAILSRHYLSSYNVVMLFVVLLSIILNNNYLIRNLQIVENNQHHMIAIFEDDTNNRIMTINRSTSAKFTSSADERLDYIAHVENHYVQPLLEKKAEAKSILVIGAVGFTFGHDDQFNHYTFVDIDPQLQDIAQKHLLKAHLSANKHYVPLPARAFLKQNTQSYDLIFVDTFTNTTSIPFQLITEEFFQQVKQQLNEGGIMIANIIAQPQFSDRFSAKIDNTLRHVFGNISRQILGSFNGWEAKEQNIIYSYRHQKQNPNHYTDNLNTYFLDR
jgi:spermidine synthase